MNHPAGTGPTASPLRGKLRLDVAMASHVSWRAGGHAARVYVPADLADLQAFMQSDLVREPIAFLGLGSNLLVRDGGFVGTLVLLHRALGRIELERVDGDLGVLYAEAGVANPKLARYAVCHDLVGAEFLAGIPGTLGGALAMNAGCYGGETWAIVSQVLTLDRAGALQRRTPEDFRIGYRQVEPVPSRAEWFVAAWLTLRRGDGKAARAEIKRLLAARAASQPLELPNAGSVFRNPPGDHAARLIESCGLKGRTIGGAQVSEKHANFIVNIGGATASDIEALIDLVETTVAERTGVHLQREVRILGERI